MQRPDHAGLNGKSETQPAADDDQGECPLNFRRVVVDPEKRQRDNERRQTRRERLEENQLLVREAAVG